MSKRVCLIVSLMALFVFIGSSVACSSTPAPATLDIAAVRAYADPATETTLQGLSENNLAKYTQYGNAMFKSALTQDVFNTMVAQINTQLGAYQSKEFLSTAEDQGYILVHYRAKFAKMEVGIRMVFDKEHLVAGQWFE